MPSEQDKVKRRRPQFSMRTLVVVVTLVGLYFGAWELTKHWGVGLVAPETRKTDQVAPRPRPFDSSPAPFVVSRERYYGIPAQPGDYREHQHLVLWLHRPFAIRDRHRIRGFIVAISSRLYPPLADRNHRHDFHSCAHRPSLPLRLM